MNKLLLITSILLFSILYKANGQDVGLSFSYFFPKNGDFSVPVTPLSFRGLGVDFTSFSGIETGISLYRMSGMNMKDIPFESDKALVGPFFSVFVPLELVLFAEGKRSIFKLKGGGFAFYNFDTRLNEGNIDRALRDNLGWMVLNSDFNVDNNIGLGYLFGGEIVYYVNKKMGLNVEVQYLVGESKLNMRGSYSGLPSENSSYQVEEVAFPDSKLDFTGFEISLGAIFTP